MSESQLWALNEPRAVRHRVSRMGLRSCYQAAYASRFTSGTWRLSAFVIFVLSCVTHASADEAPAVRSLLGKHCIVCHGPDTQEADLRFDRMTGGAAELRLWSAVLEQVETGAMPPKDEPRLSRAEQSVITTWIRQKFPQAAEALARKMERPENGNLVPHERLFDPKTAEQAPKIAASPARLWRTLPQSYENKQEAWLKKRGVNVAMSNGQGKRFAYFPAPFGLHGEHELKNYSFRYTLEASQAEGVANNARVLLALVIDSNPKNNESLIRTLARSAEPPKPDDVDKVIEDQYRHWLGRVPKAAELARRRTKVLESIRKFGNREGLIFGLVPIMIHPEVFFHTEFGTRRTGLQARPVTTGSGRAWRPDLHEPILLSPKELVDSVDRALRDRRDEAKRNPSKWQIGYGNPIVRDFFVVAAADGKLKSREDVIAAFDEAAHHKRVARLSESETVKRFLKEYFNYTHYFEVFKDVDELQKEKDAGRLFGTFAERFNNGIPETVVSKTRGVIDRILKEDRHVLGRLLSIETNYRGDSEATMLTQFETSKRKLEDGVKQFERRLAPDSGKQLSEKDRTNISRNLDRRKKALAELLEKHPDWLAPARKGVLTQRSWLVSHSNNTENDPIHRGKWIRERLLGGRVPDVPITVDAALPEAPEKTLRERMQKTRSAECWKCHRLMDPLGLPFEQYDHFGSTRSTELDRPVVTTGEIIESGDPALDGPVAGPGELVQKLAKSERVQQVFVRYAFRFWMGRNETLDDARTIQNAWLAYKENDGSMSALLKSLLTSDAFLYRSGAIP